ncbi:hypothetical protein Q8W25_16000 [Shimia thalassica]|uniref:hypothetical protein n=1 Tax=Shimia thalassica TaxID=1715693 RepID=UPI002736364F|nr:hypothetical protein [Shimia thalassica]MDP2495534.1 hypothetical protein [Shimia thalassica]
MKNPLVDFLTAYGPVPNAQNMYDEFVSEASRTAGIAPLEIEESRSKTISEKLMSNQPVSVILTGTAGDGKTYTARKCFDIIQDGKVEWDSSQVETSIECPSNGTTVTFVKDLSEMTSAEKQALMPRLLSAITGASNNEVFVICVNDGHLLKTWREHVGRDADSERAILKIQGLLKDDREVDPELNLLLVNMSRTSHASTLDKIIDAITDHPEWSSCKECPVYSAEKRCPILINREIIQRRGEETIRTRLRSLIELAAADDAHLSIRQIILIVVNSILGDRKQGTSSLLNCNRARIRAQGGERAETNPYSNIFGDNHPPSRKRNYSAFSVLGKFYVGEETSNYFDDALLDPDDAHPLPPEDEYGKAIFDRIGKDYRDDPTNNISALRPAILDQRRRLFFLSPDVDLRSSSRPRSPWHLTTFYWGDLYVNLLTEEAERNLGHFKSTRGLILKGLNRTLIGALTDTDKDLWLPQPSGVYHGAEKPLLAFDPIGWRGHLYKLNLSAPQMPGRPPKLQILQAVSESEISALNLTPTLFEYLVRVAHGALPTSFSNQCYQDVRNFQIRSVGAILALNEEKGICPIYKVVDSSSDKLTASDIEILLEAE